MERGQGRRLVQLLGGALLVASMFAGWVDRGAGSSMALHAIGDLLLEGTLSATASRWFGVVVYLIPVSGAALMLGAGMGGRAERYVTRVALVVAVVMTSMGVVLPLWKHHQLGFGQALAVAGSVLVAGSLINRRKRSTGTVP